MHSITSSGFNLPITSVNWTIQATNDARRIAAENAPKDTTTWANDDASRLNYIARLAVSNSINYAPNASRSTIYKMSTLPARSAKIAAIAKIAKIMKEEMEYEDNEY